MPLSAHVLRTERVRLSNDNDFAVRAVTFPDLALLVQDRMPEMIAIVAKYQEGQEEIRLGGRPDVKTIGQIALMACRDFPNLTTEIISSCIHGEVVTPEVREMVSQLSVAVQLDALTKIAKLTVEEAGGLGNLFSDFRETLQAAVGSPTTETTRTTPLNA